MYGELGVRKEEVLGLKWLEKMEGEVEGNEEGWNDMWVKGYGSGLVKGGWGEVVKKGRGMGVGGGMEVDGDSMLSEGEGEMEGLEEELGSGEE